MLKKIKQKKFWQKYGSLFVLLNLLFLIGHTTFAKAHGSESEHAQEEIDIASAEQRNPIPNGELDFQTATIYYNEACGMCAMHVNSELPQMLQPHGINNFIKKDYVNERQHRVEMNQMMDKFDVPLELQSHIMTFIEVESRKSKVN